MPKKFLPKVVTANDLFDGDVVYLTDAGDWSREHADAAVAMDADSAEALLAKGAAQPGRIVGAYLADAEIDMDGRPQPVHFREKIRTLGPSVRPDLGKQADAALEETV